MKIRKRKIAGLHLWACQVEYTEMDFYARSRVTCLWITTGTQKVENACRKLDAFIRKAQYGKPKVTKIKYRGTIDA